MSMLCAVSVLQDSVHIPVEGTVLWVTYTELVATMVMRSKTVWEVVDGSGPGCTGWGQILMIGDSTSLHLGRGQRQGLY